MEPRDFLLSKLAVGMVLTIVAPCRGISYHAIDMARRNIFSPGVIIDDYILCLRAWKFYRSMRDKRSLKAINPSFSLLNGNIQCRVIAEYIAEKWFLNDILYQALPDIIDEFRSNVLSIDEYIQKLHPRRIPEKN